MPQSLADLQSLVVLNANTNQLTGGLGDYAFGNVEDRNDLNSALRILDFGSNALSGAGRPSGIGMCVRCL